MAAALMTMTQCRKQETVPAMPSANTIKMTITAGPGAKTDITDEGRIKWTSGDKLYVSDGENWLGSLDLYSGAGSATGKFTGEISGISDGTTCHFFYLGHDNGMTGATGTANAVISFASQDGSKDDAFKYHLGHGKAVVTVIDDVATGAVSMRTEIAIAHLKLKMDGEDYTGPVTMDVSNTMTVSPGGTFSGSGNGITIGNGDGEHGDRYVTLIPTEETNVSFSGCATGSMTFGQGIHANNLYGMTNGIEVTVEAAKFSVGENTTVEFAPGNLWADATDAETPVFYFETNQWSFADDWDASHVSHFKWCDAETAVTDDEYYSYSENLFCSENFTVDGDSHNDWRTLSDDEWNYLLKERREATELCAWKDLDDDGEHKGLVILPDDTEEPLTVMDDIITVSDLASFGAVFLPVAGVRDRELVIDLDAAVGYYWSSTPLEDYDDDAYYLRFDPGWGNVYTEPGTRGHGRTVRLVRDR